MNNKAIVEHVCDYRLFAERTAVELVKRFGIDIVLSEFLFALEGIMEENILDNRTEIVRASKNVINKTVNYYETIENFYAEEELLQSGEEYTPVDYQYALVKNLKEYFDPKDVFTVLLHFTEDKSAYMAMHLVENHFNKMEI